MNDAIRSGPATGVSTAAPRGAPSELSYVREAFRAPGNLAFVAGAAVLLITLAAFLGGGTAFSVAMLCVLLAEGGYLAVRPRQERFRLAVRARRRAGRAEVDHLEAQRRTYRQLSRQSQRRYARLRQLQDAIAAHYRSLSVASQDLLQGHLHKIDGLLDAYLHLLARRTRHQQDAGRNGEDDVRRSIEDLLEHLEEATPRVREARERRLRVLKRRLRSFSERHEHRDLVEAQLQTIEDTVRYIHEQSWTLQDPERITRELDALLDEVEHTRASVQQVEEVFARSPDELLDDLPAHDGRPLHAR